jgi:hypothetical protein
LVDQIIDNNAENSSQYLAVDVDISSRAPNDYPPQEKAQPMPIPSSLLVNETVPNRSDDLRALYIQRTNGPT